MVKFDNAYFHPKVVHVERADGSMAAYVGSANITSSGVGSLHVEAGVTVDTADGDDEGVATEIALGIDAWFTEARPGLYVVDSEADVAALVDQRILNVPQPPRPSTKRGGGAGGAPNQGAQLQRLFEIPPLPVGVVTQAPVAGPGPADAPGATAPAPAPAPADQWEKRLSASDAQRKPSGNQRGSITLVGGQAGVDTQSWFRGTLFHSATWAQEDTRTGQTKEEATVPFQTTVLGQDLGIINLKVSYAANREADEGNYTSLLHLGALSDQFRNNDLTGHTIRIVHYTDDTFSLDIV